MTARNAARGCAPKKATAACSARSARSPARRSSRAGRFTDEHAQSAQRHWKSPEDRVVARRPHRDSSAVGKSENPLRRLFGKTPLAGAPDDYGNYDHGSLRLNTQLSVERGRPQWHRASWGYKARPTRRLVIAPRPAQEGTNLVPEHTKVTIELPNRRRLLPCLQFGTGIFVCPPLSQRTV